MVQAAEEYPNITFVADTGGTAAVCGLPNVKNAFPHTFESRYVSGVVAGMKLKELMDAGTVTAPYAAMSVRIPMLRWFPAIPLSSWAFATLSPKRRPLTP